jgi:hypothetical protein
LCCCSKRHLQERGVLLRLELMIRERMLHISVPLEVRCEKKIAERHSPCIRHKYDGIEYRGYAQDIVETLAKYSGVPFGMDLLTNSILHKYLRTF